MEITCWDVGGRTPLRTLWRHYYENTQGIIFVVDSNDRYTIEYAEEELRRILCEVLLIGIPLLIYANKIDLPNIMSIEEIKEKLKLKDDKNVRKIHIQPCSVTKKVGINEGMSWLIQNM
jgi:small GTP-binding protein